MNNFHEIVQNLRNNQEIFEVMIRFNDYQYDFYLNDQIRLEIDFLATRQMKWFYLNRVEIKSFELLFKALNHDEILNLLFNIDVLSDVLKFNDK